MSVRHLCLGASGESLGATPLATEARNSCLFCCTRHAARIILWRGVRRYGLLTFCARSSVTISKSVWVKKDRQQISCVLIQTGFLKRGCNCTTVFPYANQSYIYFLVIKCLIAPNTNIYQPRAELSPFKESLLNQLVISLMQTKVNKFKT